MKKTIECAFCPNEADSAEHIFSKWMNKLLGPHKYWFERWMPGGRIISFSGDKIDLKAPVVCTPCNNGWMNDIENLEAKPVLANMLTSGYSQSILPRGLAAIAAFAFKTTVVVNHMRPDNPPFFARSDRHEFRRSLRIPDGVQMWLSSRARKRTGTLNSVIGKSPRNMIGSFEIYVCTFTLSYVVIQTVSARWADTSPFASHPFPGFRQDSKWDSVAIPFWPLSGNGVLWPLQVMADNLVQPFSYRWKDLEIPQWMANKF